MNTQRQIRVTPASRNRRAARPVDRASRTPGATWRAAAIAMTLGCAASGAHAESFFTVEAGLGRATYRDQGNMIWYQQGLPYSLSLSPPAFMAGFAGDIVQRSSWGISWHADYVYLGTVHTNAIATTDENYNPQTQSCRGACVAQTRFTGHGNVSGLAFTIEPHYDWRGFRLGVEGGPFVFLPSWTESLTPADPQPGVGATTVHASARLRVGAVVGISVGYKNLTVSLQHYFDKSKDEYTPIWSSTNLVMVRYRF
jgi:hypothetical protein